MEARPKHIYFVGIAGIGVSALAQVAQARGIRVSGADPHANPDANPAVRRLLTGGAEIHAAHRKENVAEDVDLVVATAAVGEDNPEVLAARECGIRVVSRAAFLGELMVAHKGPKIAVAGTHGKTTTTGMIGVMLQEAGLDPTVFVGGEVAQLGGNVLIGGETGPFVAEACEAYDSFLYLKPDIAVITNVEADHLDHYGTFERVVESFRRFLSNLSDSGTVVGCMEDAGFQEVYAGLPETLGLLAYGIESWDAVSRAENVTLAGGAAFDWVYTPPRPSPSQGEGEELAPSLRRRGLGEVHITLQVPGRHNVLNALAAASVGRLLDIDMETVAAGLAAFRGAQRRQEILGEVKGVLVMDDYAHHPTEITATIEALRSAYPKRRLVVVFQPHLYSRTRDFLPGFAEALARADALVVTDVYAAREQPILGVQAADIVSRAAERNPNIPTVYLPDKRDIPSMLRALVRPNDLALFLGAGDIREQGEAFVEVLREERTSS